MKGMYKCTSGVHIELYICASAEYTHFSAVGMYCIVQHKGLEGGAVVVLGFKVTK